MRKTQEEGAERSVVECPLSQPWLYLRSGIYYLRVRPKGVSKDSVTVSLHTSDKQIADAVSKLLVSSLLEFQLDNPAANWFDLAAHLKNTSKAVSSLSQGEYLDAGAEEYAEVLSALQQAVAARRGIQAKALKDSFDKEGLSNPIGKFTCPHCLEDDCDVEYVRPAVGFPSGRAGHVNGDIDVGRCFQCGGMSYWLVLDSHSSFDRADLLRKLLFPLVEEAATRLLCNAIADGIRNNPTALDNFIENIKRGIPLHEFAKRADLKTRDVKGGLKSTHKT